MTNLNTKPVWLGLLLGTALATGASCTVDKSGIVFDDKPFEDGDSDGSDSVDDGSGGGGGEPGTGGSPGGTGGSVGGGCENGELTCDSRQVQMCVFGQVIDVGGECSNACIDGVCGGVCVPTTTECQGVTHLRTCSAAGEWTVPAVCENQACADGACVGECAPGAYSCRGTNNGMPVQCNDQGAWVDLRPSNCINDACTNGVCTGTCANGETQCVGPGFNNWQECQAGSWVNQTACQYVCTGNACGGECVPGDKRCNGATLQSCSFGGAWVTDQTCPFVCTDDSPSQCSGVCVPGSRRCSPSEPTYIEDCDSTGHWATSVKCEGEDVTCKVVGEKVLCQQCIPGERRCDGTVAQQCSDDGYWKSDECWGRSDNADYCYQAECLTKDEITKMCSRGLEPVGCFKGAYTWGCSVGEFTYKSCSPQVCLGDSGRCTDPVE